MLLTIKSYMLDADRFIFILPQNSFFDYDKFLLFSLTQANSSEPALVSV